MKLKYRDNKKNTYYILLIRVNSVKSKSKYPTCLYDKKQLISLFITVASKVGILWEGSQQVKFVFIIIICATGGKKKRTVNMHQNRPNYWTLLG